MPTITTFAEAQDALRPLYDNSRTAYTLDTMRSLMEFLGNPQDKLKVVHIAGTSGKTSTAYYCSALLRQTGVTVGMTVSPHIDNLNERLQINGEPLPEAEFCGVLGEFLELVEQSGIKLSYFELLVAMAYWELARRKVDYAVIEVGLGGLLDGTNVVTKADKVCVITDIGLDHTEILGDTLDKIATQKAGIIHEGNVVFMYTQDDDVMTVVRQVASQKNADLHEIDPNIDLPRMPADTGYIPIFQERNLTLAEQVIFYIVKRDDLVMPEFTLESEMKILNMVVPARLERFSLGSKVLFIDGSHNQQKLKATIESLRKMYQDRPLAVLCAFVNGNAERWQRGLDEMLPYARHIIFTSFQGEQDLPKKSVDPQMLADYARTQSYTNFTVEPRPAEAYELLTQRPETALLVTGSFYLLNHIRPLVGVRT